MRAEAPREVRRHFPALRLTTVAEDARADVDLAGRLGAVVLRHEAERRHLAPAVLHVGVGVTPRVDHRQVRVVRVLGVERKQAREVQARRVDRGPQARPHGQHVPRVALRLREQVVVVEAADRHRRHSFDMRLRRGAGRVQRARGNEDCRDGCCSHNSHVPR